MQDQLSKSVFHTLYVEKAMRKQAALNFVASSTTGTVECRSIIIITVANRMFYAQTVTMNRVGAW